jgi:hypothetical protein
VKIHGDLSVLSHARDKFPPNSSWGVEAATADSVVQNRYTNKGLLKKCHYARNLPPQV